MKTGIFLIALFILGLIAHCTNPRWPVESGTILINFWQASRKIRENKILSMGARGVPGVRKVSPPPPPPSTPGWEK